MARSSSGKSVARAAATGGGATYRGQMPVNWYAALVVIVLVGLGSIAVAKYHYDQTPAVVEPTTTTTWHAALAFDICGTMEPALAASPTSATTGLTSSGNGVLQIAPKSRTEVPEYADMEQVIGSAAGRINGAYGEADWTPIRYVNRAYSHSTLAGLYRAARVGLVTPLRDGMNLVAKEYVASQDPEDPGVLILSRFAGAAVECEAALLVNPYDPESVGSAIAQALSMPLEERRRRHDALFQVLMTNDVESWGERFLIALTRPLNLPNWLGQTDFSLV